MELVRAVKKELGARILGMTLLPSGNIDADNIQGVCAYQITGNDIERISNLPSQVAGVLWIPMYQQGYWRIQFYLEQSSLGIWFRTGASSSWSSWRKLSFT